MSPTLITPCHHIIPPPKKTTVDICHSPAKTSLKKTKRLGLPPAATTPIDKDSFISSLIQNTYFELGRVGAAPSADTHTATQNRTTMARLLRHRSPLGISLLCLTVGCTTAFQSRPSFATKKPDVPGVIWQRSSVTLPGTEPSNDSTFSAEDDDQSADTTAEPAVVLPESDSAAVTDNVMAMPPLDMEEDIAKDLFLQNSQENLVLTEIFEPNNEPPAFKGLGEVVAAGDAVPEVGIEEQGPVANEESEMNDTVNKEDGASPAVLDNTLVVDDVDVRDTVQAILAASEEAVAVAEASLLSEDVAAKLDTFGADVAEVESEVGTGEVDDKVSEILPASSVVGDTPAAVDSKILAPSVAKILAFAIPATGVWLCDPLLSLIDTSAVGMLSGTVHQAALTPACAVTDYAALLIAFVFTATTNLIAAAREADRGVEGSPRMTRNLVGSLQLSTYVGAGLGTVLFVYARQFVMAIVGSSSGVNPAVVEAATIYVRIRALGMPAAAMIGSAQAACLGMQDIKSQFIVLAAAAVVNFMGDVLLVGSKHPWLGGAAGAAWATVFSQYVAVGFFAHWLCRLPKKLPKRKKTVNVSDAILKLTKKRDEGKAALKDAVDSVSASQTKTRNNFLAKGKRLFSPSKLRAPVSDSEKNLKPSKEKAFSVRGFLQGRVHPFDMVKLPSRDIIKEFWPYFLPVTFAQIGRVSGYVAMSYVVASSLGTRAMAAQQIVASLVYCLFPVADSLSLTGQSFVPPIAEKSPSKERARALRRTMINLSKAAGIFGLFTAALVGFTPLISGYFTSDPLVVSMVNGVVPMLAASFPVYALVMAFEGLLLGQKDLGFQGKMYTSWCFIVPYFMLRVKKAALGGANVGINAVWGVLTAYQVVRFLSWAGRALMLQRQAEREVEHLPAQI